MNKINWAKIIIVISITLFIVFTFIFIIQTDCLCSFNIKDPSKFGSLLAGIFTLSTALLLYITFKKQRDSAFENVFFNLLKTQRELVKSLKSETDIVDVDGKTVKPFTGDEYIGNASEELVRIFDKEFNLSDENLETIIDKRWRDFFWGKELHLGRYFRHLYHIVKFVDESEIENKKKYIDFIQSQMSEDELHISFYNSIAIYGRTRVKPLFKKHKFFEDIGIRNDIILIKLCEIYYPDTKLKYLPVHYDFMEEEINETNLQILKSISEKDYTVEDLRDLYDLKMKDPKLMNDKKNSQYFDELSHFKLLQVGEGRICKISWFGKYFLKYIEEKNKANKP